VPLHNETSEQEGPITISVLNSPSKAKAMIDTCGAGPHTMTVPRSPRLRLFMLMAPTSLGEAGHDEGKALTSGDKEAADT